MHAESLIPFGLHTESGQLVDVASVPRGKKCGCICPSCKTPLVARQGNSNIWCFAHRSRNVHTETKRECDYSFAVSVRLMIRQLAEGEGLRFRTPSYRSSVSVFCQTTYQRHVEHFTVAEDSLLLLKGISIGADFEGVVVDVLGSVSDIPFVIYVTYKGRTLPDEICRPANQKCGVVEVAIEGLKKIFEEIKDGQYVAGLRSFIEDDTDGKSWVYHPRAAKTRLAAEERAKIWLDQQNDLASHNKTKALPRDNTLRSLSPARTTATGQEISHGGTHQVPQAPDQHFVCVMCGQIWSGTSYICPTCDTHLYTKQL